MSPVPRDVMAAEVRAAIERHGAALDAASAGTGPLIGRVLWGGGDG
jgi:hypothetical protein